KIYQFPLWGDPQRGVPNDLIRCALFAAAKGIDGQYNERVPVFAQGDFSITYSGPSLTQDHLDVFEAIMHLAREMPEENAVRFTAHSLLKLIGRSTGKSDHDRLLRSLEHLTTTAVTIKRKGHGTYCGSLLPEWADREEDGKFSFRVNRNLIKLFDRGFTVIEWEQRKKLARSPLAKHLQLWLSSHDKPYPVTVQYLHDITG
ncbi:MAG: RepB family plasmid replication initiator protein, partial [Rhodobacteraceae bacterium]|nr:RepB family plasmid replication initiator protein [Paracoccaceae bacterium]